MKRMLFLACAAALQACTSPSNIVSGSEIAAVETAAERFHQHLISGDDAAIYEEAAGDFRNNTTRENLIATTARFRSGTVGCAAARRDPERIKITNRAMLVGEGMSGRFVAVVYVHACGPRTVTETLTFKLRNDVATLIGAHFSGPQFSPEPLAPTPEPGQALPPLPPPDPETAPAVVPPNAG
ncbi:MAG: hypothetical protein IV086_12100 [Hyphomonadaceae bacterium]|nr:hypothetical protein [Hyphomonadaceae bacterium]